MSVYIDSKLGEQYTIPDDYAKGDIILLSSDGVAFKFESSVLAEAR